MEKTLQDFLHALDRDNAKYIKKWMLAWNYQLKRKKTNKRYEEGIISDFFDYKGKEDLVKWMNWFGKEPYKNYINPDILNDLIKKSHETDEAILSKLGLTYDFNVYDGTVGLNNAHDFFIPQMYPVPERNKIKTVVDFGAGNGRQANLWSRNDRTFIGIDAIPSSYCLQNLYYHNLTNNVTDYIEVGDEFKLDTKKKGIFHLPTWRMDLIPPSSCDLVICIQVLGELNAKLIKWVGSQFERILKPGGMLYIRDNGRSVKMATSFDYDNYFSNHGFSLEYWGYIINDSDIHGIPRIYRKHDPAVTKSQTKSTQQRTKEIISELDYISGGTLKKIKKTLSK